MSKGFADSALKDAEKCIELKPDWVEDYSRKGAAFHKLKKYDKSIDAYQKGLAIDPDNVGLLNGLKAVQEEQKNPNPMGNNPLAPMFDNILEVAKNSPNEGIEKYK